LGVGEDRAERRLDLAMGAEHRERRRLDAGAEAEDTQNERRLPKKFLSPARNLRVTTPAVVGRGGHYRAAFPRTPSLELGT
jgi:hypothetical protein